jgi:hypothetical protein
LPAIHKPQAVEKAPRRGLSRALSWIWKAPLLAVGGIAALACLAFVLLITLWLLFLARDAVVQGARAAARLPLMYALAPFALTALALTLGRVGRKLLPYVEPGLLASDARPVSRLTILLLALLAIATAAVAYFVARPILYVAAQNDPVGAFLTIGAAAVGGFVIVRRAAGPINSTDLVVARSQAHHAGARNRDPCRSRTWRLAWRDRA